MLFGFNKLYLACIKYGFGFILCSEEYKRNLLKMDIKPNDNKLYSISVTGKNYRELFKNAITKMKRYRNESL